MANDYQRKSKYRLPAEVWHQTLWVIRDYERMLQESQSILEETSQKPDVMTRERQISDEVANKAIRREQCIVKINKVNKALKAIPTEYRKGVWDSIVYRKPYPMDADRSTYGRYKTLFVHKLAKLLYLI